MKDNLIVINKYKCLIEKYSDYILVYPKKYYYLKDKIENLLFDILKEMYIVNSLSDKQSRCFRKEELIGCIKYLNYLFVSINRLNILSDKQYKVMFMSIEEVYKYLVGWLKSDR